MAYGINSPFGLQPRWNLQGGGFTGTLSSYIVASAYANSIFTGDPVRLLNDGTIGLGAAGLPTSGVFFGCKYTDPAGNFVYSPYWPAGQATLNNSNVQALIVDAPDTLFDVQASYSGAGVDATTVQLGVKQSDLNKNANFAIGGTFAANPPPNNPASGDTRSGQSGFYLDLRTLGNNAGANLKIIRLVPVQNAGSVLIANSGGNAFYTVPSGLGVGAGNFNNVVVSLNNDSFRGGTGTSVEANSYIATGTLTNAQVLAISNATPLQLIPPPGPGYIIVVKNWSLESVGTTPYVGASTLHLAYNTGGAGITASAAITAGVLVNGGTPSIESAVGIATVFSIPQTSNQGISLGTSAAAFTGGAGNNVNWSIDYTIVAV